MIHSPEVTIALAYDDAGFRLAGPAAAALRTFDDAVWETIIERATVLSRTSPLSLTFILHASVDQHAAHLTEAVRLYFARRRMRAAYELRRALHDGRSSLMVGAVLLIVVLTLAQALDGVAATSRVVAAVREGLTIVGWVALWRPAELLLYSPWMLKREIALFRQLENAEVVVRSDS